MITHNLDTDDQALCDLCLEFIQPEDPKIIIGNSYGHTLTEYHSNWMEIYHPTCYAKLCSAAKGEVTV